MQKVGMWSSPFCILHDKTVVTMYHHGSKATSALSFINLYIYIYNVFSVTLDIMSSVIFL